jgi:hypothetical protein
MNHPKQNKKTTAPSSLVCLKSHNTKNGTLKAFLGIMPHKYEITKTLFRLNWVPPTNKLKPYSH